MDKCPHCGGDLPEKEPPAPSEKVNEVINTWNEFAKPLALPLVREGNKKVVVQIRARLKEKTFAEDLPLALAQILSRDFYRGVNDTGWKANLEWLTRAGKAAELASARRADTQGKKGGRNDPEAGRFSSRKRAD